MYVSSWLLRQGIEIERFPRLLHAQVLRMDPPQYRSPVDRSDADTGANVAGLDDLSSDTVRRAPTPMWPVDPYDVLTANELHHTSNSFPLASPSGNRLRRYIVVSESMRGHVCPTLPLRLFGF